KKVRLIDYISKYKLFDLVRIYKNFEKEKAQRLKKNLWAFSRNLS
ncbi:MAG: hypothetical protein K940chlam1_01251, partial [Candidatus Anoxychlamydiales bacterium]|nr:hypothetical protein [Candidatus Anoxychlamydiales bacterium]